MSTLEHLQSKRTCRAPRMRVHQGSTVPTCYTSEDTRAASMMRL